MWRNTDLDAFVGWLREHNASVRPERRAGFYGFDLHNLNGSIRAVIDYLDRVDPDAAALDRARYGSLSPCRQVSAAYGLTAPHEGFALCDEAGVQQPRTEHRHNVGVGHK